MSVAGYDVALRTASGSGITLVSVSVPAAAYPALYPSVPTTFPTGSMLGVTDSLPSGAAQLDNNDGLFSVRFAVAPGVGGEIPLIFNATFTNLADADGNPIPIELAPGTITVTPPLSTITGTSGNDVYHVVRSGTQLWIYENSSPVGAEVFQPAIGDRSQPDHQYAGGRRHAVCRQWWRADVGDCRLIYNSGTAPIAWCCKAAARRIDSTAAGGTLE